MTGPEHYREAERLLAGRTIPADPELGDPAEYYPPTAAEIERAHIHATLAHTAATVLTAYPDTDLTNQQYGRWACLIRQPRPAATDEDDA